jgi:hypothetical protein
VYGVFRDPVLLTRLEADFLQFYGIDLHDLYRPEASLTVRRVADLIDQLPEESRLVKYITDDPWNTNQHLLANVADAMNQVWFYSRVSAASQMKSSDAKKVFQSAPKLMERPSMKPKPKPKPQFLSGRQLKEALGQAQQKRVIAHAAACIASKVNKQGELNCSCPPISR